MDERMECLVKELAKIKDEWLAVEVYGEWLIVDVNISEAYGPEEAALKALYAFSRLGYEINETNLKTCWLILQKEFDKCKRTVVADKGE